MTKSRQSVTKLRLSRLIRCLLAVGAIKLAIMAFGVLDLPMPAWKGEERIAASAQPEPAPAPIQTVSEAPVPASPSPEPLPQGAAAAELAAAARPRAQGAPGLAALPAPLVTAGPLNLLADDGRYFSQADLPEPQSLGAPLARAGVELPREEQEPLAKNEENIWDMLDLKSLPIPGLGSVQAAHAAALDMPVPTAPKTASPFAPAEQVAPLASQPRVLPGAPPFPANIPNGQAGDGAPLQPRQATIGQSGGYAPQPAQNPLHAAPAPNITARQSPLDPNVKAQDLARQQQDILMLRQQMDQRLKDLQEAESKMKEMLQQANEAEDKKVKSLVQVYANMKPRMAAQALENLDERVAVRILSGMAPKQSGEILTYTNPAKTAKLTEMLTRMRISGQ